MGGVAAFGRRLGSGSVRLRPSFFSYSGTPSSLGSVELTPSISGMGKKSNHSFAAI